MISYLFYRKDKAQQGKNQNINSNNQNVNLKNTEEIEKKFENTSKTE